MTDVKIIDLWHRAAQSYETVVPYFEVMGERMVELAALQPGERVLDIACGKGASLIPAARAVGPAGVAVGIDIVSQMAEIAREALQAAGLTHAEARVMDGEDMSFLDDSFDVALCGAGLAFVGMRPGLTEIARVLRPGGRMLASAPTGGGPQWNFFSELVSRFGLAPIPLDIPSSEQMDELFEEAGLRDRVVHHESFHVDFPDEEAWWSWAWSHGQRWFLEQLSPQDAEAFKQAAFEHLRGFKTAEGIPLDQGYMVVSAIAH